MNGLSPGLHLLLVLVTPLVGAAVAWVLGSRGREAVRQSAAGDELSGPGSSSRGCTKRRPKPARESSQELRPGGSTAGRRFGHRARSRGATRPFGDVPRRRGAATGEAGA